MPKSTPAPSVRAGGPSSVNSMTCAASTARRCRYRSQWEAAMRKVREYEVAQSKTDNEQ